MNKLFSLNGILNRKSYLINSIKSLVLFLFSLTLILTMLASGIDSLLVIGLGIVMGFVQISIMYSLVLRRVRDIFGDTTGSVWYGTGVFLLLFIPYFGIVLNVLTYILPTGILKKIAS